MAEVLGPLSILNKALPSGVDGSRLAEWALQDGVTWQSLMQDVARALGTANQNLVNKWGWLFSLTEELFMEYPNGGTVTPMPKLTDLDEPTTVHGTTIGHMIDIARYGRGIGGTTYYFMNARSATINAAISTLVNEYIWRFEVDLLTRALTNTENQIGSGGYDVPFVRGTGGNIDFAPPAYNGEAFTTSHDHFLGLNKSTSGVIEDDMLEALAETVQEHGHDAPFRALVSRADIAAYAALTGFIQLVDISGLLLDRGGVTSGNQFFTTGNVMENGGHIGNYQSAYGKIELYATARIPTGHAWLGKSYGQLDARNSLAVRVHPRFGFGVQVVPETIISDEAPIKKLDVQGIHGIGVGMDRTNGASGFLVAGGTYANAAIS